MAVGTPTLVGRALPTAEDAWAIGTGQIAWFTPTVPTPIISTVSTDLAMRHRSCKNLLERATIVLDVTPYSVTVFEKTKGHRIITLKN